VFIFAMILLLMIPGEPAAAQSDVRQAVEEFIFTRAASTGDSLVVEFRSVIPSPDEFGAGCRVVIRSEGTLPARGNMTIPVEIVRGTVMVKKMTVSIKVRTFGTVLVAGRQLDRHEVLKRSDVTSRYLETTALAEGSITSAEEIVGKRTTKIIASGDVINGRWLERPPDIHRQDRVTLVAKGSSVLLSSVAVALEDGRIGESIRVRRNGSGGSVAAKVVDATTVQVTIGEK
jgi:flagellar basal body P-ring formation protein FlgA